MAVLSNVERGPLMRTVDNLGVPFAELVAAEDVRSYKPAPNHFEQLRERLGERASGQVHVAGSIYHDIKPAVELGIPVIWVNRKGESVPRNLNAQAVKSDLLQVCEELGV